jgi:hypothetical protein
MIEVSASTLAEALGRHPFRFRHGLGIDHALVARKMLAARADEWPSSWVEHHLADLPYVLPSGKTDQLPIDAGDVVRGIDDNSCWVVLWHMEHNPVYRALLDECMTPIDEILPEREGRMTRRGMNVLIGSPQAVVPAHFDLHHNLLLQVEGTKEFNIGSFADPAVEARELDRYFDDRTNNARDLPDIVTTYSLGPGDGVYIPPYAMHWTRGGAEGNVGVSVGFQTAVTDRRCLVHQCNASLRRRGLHPKPAGQSEHRDRAKVAAFTQARRLRQSVQPVLTRVRRAPTAQRS